MLTARDLVEMSMGKTEFRQAVRETIYKGLDEDLETRPPIFEIEAEIMNFVKIRIQEINETLEERIMTAEGMQVLLDNL